MVETFKTILDEKGFGEPVKTIYRWIDGILVSAVCHFPDGSSLASENAGEAADWLEADE